MADYIDLDTPLELIVARGDCFSKQITTLRELLDVNKIPYAAADVRPVGLLEQVEWERDTALAQLAEIGKSFGERMDDVRPVVRCSDCKWTEIDGTGAIYCKKWDRWEMPPNGFCWLGRKREES